MKQLFRNGAPLTTTPSEASKINYNNSVSGLAANNIQKAVDELSSKLTDIVKDAETGMTIHEKLDIILGNADIDIGGLNIEDVKVAVNSLSGYDKAQTVTTDDISNYSHILILTTWAWSTEMGISDHVLMTIDEFENAGEVVCQYEDSTDSIIKVKYVSNTSISLYRGSRSGAVILLIKSKNDYEEYRVSILSNTTKQENLAGGVLLSDNGNTLVSLTDNYLFTALKPCKAIINHCGYTYSSKNTKVCFVNDTIVNTSTDNGIRFILTLEPGDTLYLARTNGAAYYTDNIAYLRFEPI